MNRRTLIASSALALWLLGCASHRVPDSPSTAAIKAAVANPSRPADDRKLDPDRKPAAVLEFAGVKPGMTVAEYLPGGGYYTRLLSYIVGPDVMLFALETTTWGDEAVDATKEAVADLPNVSMNLSPLGTFELPVPVDLFWTTNNYHDLKVPKYANVDITAFNRKVFDSLKPGGIYLVGDHVAADGSGASDAAALHRIERKVVIEEIKAAGFELVGQSDVLRNKADDHTKSVFDPSIRGKTDQFLLKFRRP